jgi:EAL domain-containing protein (putative c-di-GMP-specific phosphodiesterase class I)
MLLVTLMINLLATFQNTVFRNSVIPAGAAGAADMFISFLTGLFTLMIPVLSGLYVCGIFGIEFELKKKMMILYLPVIFETLVYFSGLFIPGIYSLSRHNGVAYTFPLAFLLFIQLLYYPPLTLYLAITRGHLLTREKKTSLWAFLILTLTEIPVRMVSESSSIYQFELVICLLFCEFTLQNPSENLDPDTRFWNRNAYRAMVTTAFAAEEPFLLIGILIENMSIIRSSFGSLETDELVRNIGVYLRKVDNGAEIFRTDHDTLVVMLKNIGDGEQTVQKIAERFRTPWQMKEQNAMLYTHVCSLQCPSEAGSVEETLRLISLMTQEAQSHGKEFVHLSEMDISRGERVREVDEIVKHALDEHLLEVYYQPIYSPDQGKYLSAEALLRLHHPQKGFISPVEFIPAAEHNGMIIRIGQFVLNEVCRMLKETDAISCGIEYVEVNLSIVECIQSDLAENIVRTLERNRVLPKRINLEITESAESLSGMIHENITRLSQEGFSFSLDDFGTGYSNLMRTIELPISIVKLDKSLIGPATRSKRAYDVLTDIVHMNKEMGYETVAEGVETEAESIMVQEMGCEHIQGFYYAKPMPRDEFLKFLHDRGRGGDSV